VSAGLALTDTALVLLAAGRSERFGSEDKLLAPLDGLPLAIRTARSIGALDTGWKIAVCATAASEIATGLAAEGFDIIVNPEPGRGLSSSLACGIGRAMGTDAKAALLCLADMPFVTPALALALMERFDATSRPIVASRTGEVALPPALFARTEFARLMNLTGDHGAKAMLAGAACVEFDPALLRDIDRRADLWTAPDRGR
jgi:molybdenum cofactor cytidylyltransferase